MKEGIHPNYGATTIVCASCGNVMKTNSTKKDIKVDICSKCHAFWTGSLQQHIVNGRAEKFKQKYGL